MTAADVADRTSEEPAAAVNARDRDTGPSFLKGAASLQNVAAGSLVKQHTTDAQPAECALTPAQEPASPAAQEGGTHTNGTQEQRAPNAGVAHSSKTSERPPNSPAAKPQLGDAVRQAAHDAGIAVEDNTTAITEGCFVTRGALRFALPYFFDFRLHTKKRMAGRHPVDVFASEFPVRPRAYYEAAYEEGRLRVEGPMDRATGGLKPGQCVRHFVHRHEPPVPAAPVHVLACTADLVAVHKPACTPVHVAGQYRKNTVLGILEATRPDLGVLHPVHRLDKPVSGVLLLSRNAAAADAVRAKIMAYEVAKVYLARVEGAFPDGETLLDTPLAWDSRTGLASAVSSSHAAAKDAATHVTRLRHDAASDTSLVEVRPRTGRSHQIRAHLGAAGHPIANDHDYGGTRGTPRAQWLVRRRGDAAAAAAAGPPCGDGMQTAAAPAQPVDSAAPPHTGGDLAAEAVAIRVQAKGAACVDASGSTGAPVAKRARTDLPQAGTTPGRAQRGDLGAEEAAAAAATVPRERRDAQCQHCPLLSPRDYPLDLQPLWLHAARYSCAEWDFSAPAPAWAGADFKVP